MNILSLLCRQMNTIVAFLGCHLRLLWLLMWSGIMLISFRTRLIWALFYYDGYNHYVQFQIFSFGFVYIFNPLGYGVGVVSLEAFLNHSFSLHLFTYCDPNPHNNEPSSS